MNIYYNLIKLKKILNPFFQTGNVVYGERKLRDLDMFFKPSFKCFKNKKINFSQHASNDRKSIYVKKGVLVLITS